MCISVGFSLRVDWVKEGYDRSVEVEEVVLGLREKEIEGEQCGEKMMYEKEK